MIPPFELPEIATLIFSIQIALIVGYLSTLGAKKIFRKCLGDDIFYAEFEAIPPQIVGSRSTPLTPIKGVHTMNKLKALVVSSLMVAAGSAHAALPTGVDTAFTDLGTDIATVAGYATTIALAVAVGWKIISMIKRGVGKV